MSGWIKTPNGAKDIPVGDWCVVMEDGKIGYCKARKGANCTIHIINGNFHFDRAPVIAYQPFPDLPES
ncbi:hypothetical protein [Salmonella phage NINP13076]|uniref:DUF551 domain-containing protein n=1 Tax=Salmonella phage SalP219 TaxID=3158864 RepID=A0AAU7PIE0_9CAUD|nr:hypothetical protein [Salmonella phage NINP13076]